MVININRGVIVQIISSLLFSNVFIKFIFFLIVQVMISIDDRIIMLIVIIVSFNDDNSFILFDSESGKFHQIFFIYLKVIGDESIVWDFIGDDFINSFIEFMLLILMIFRFEMILSIKIIMIRAILPMDIMDPNEDIEFHDDIESG